VTPLLTNSFSELPINKRMAVCSWRQLSYVGLVTQACEVMCGKVAQLETFYQLFANTEWLQRIVLNVSAVAGR
jgi:hypothetical protein